MIGKPAQKCITSLIHCKSSFHRQHAIHIAAITECKERITDLLLYVIQRIRRVDGEADEDDMGIGVAEGSETIIVFLAGRIPESELDVFAIDFDIGDVVLKDSRDIDLYQSKVSGWRSEYLGVRGWWWIWGRDIG
jgi:hypothetical protein